MTVESKDFALCRVKWQTQLVGAVRTREQVINEYWILVDFFQKNSLATHPLAKSESDISDEFVIMKSDLTEVGYKVFQKGHSKYVGALDRGRNPSQAISSMIRAYEAIIDGEK
jgi:hypothetical protein